MNNYLSDEINHSLVPIRKGFSFMFGTAAKAVPIAVNICALPIHGINYAIFKARNGSRYDYNGSHITKASNWLGNQLAKIPNNIAQEIRGGHGR